MDLLNLPAKFEGVDGICGSGQIGTVKTGGVENAGVDTSARYGKGGQCRSGQFDTMLQGWNLQEWTNQHDVARVDIAGVDNAAPCGRGGHCGSGQCRSGQMPKNVKNVLKTS